MSEDDVDMLGPDGQGSSRVDRDRRAPRFSWTPAYETTFFRSLCESVHLGLRENSSFKAEAWERAAQALQEAHGAYPAKSHLINKSDNARKRFRLWRGLREDPEFIYNSVSKTVTATEDAWRAHIEREPLSRALRGRPFDHEEFMEVLYPDVIGSGGAPKRIMKPRRRTDGQPGDESDMPGTAVLNLQSDSPTGQSNLESPGPPRASLSQTPTGSGTSSAAPPSRPSSTTVPIPMETSQPNALTPPDESANQAKKRALPLPPSEPAFGTSSPSSARSDNAVQSSASPEKRQRITVTSDAIPSTSATLTSSNLAAATSESPSLLHPSDAAASRSRSGKQEDTPSSPPDSSTEMRWREKALDMFFKEFVDEDEDLQLRIAENVLVDEYKALMYCKMPWKVRQHWIRKLGESFRV